MKEDKSLCKLVQRGTIQDVKQKERDISVQVTKLEDN